MGNNYCIQYNFQRNKIIKSQIIFWQYMGRDQRVIFVNTEVSENEEF